MEKCKLHIDINFDQLKEHEEMKNIETLSSKIFRFFMILFKIYSGGRLLLEKFLNLKIFADLYNESQLLENRKSS